MSESKANLLSYKIGKSTHHCSNIYLVNSVYITGDVSCRFMTDCNGGLQNCCTQVEDRCNYLVESILKETITRILRTVLRPQILTGSDLQIGMALPSQPKSGIAILPKSRGRGGRERETFQR